MLNTGSIYIHMCCIQYIHTYMMIIEWNALLGLLLVVKEFKYLGISFTRMEHKMDQHISAASAVMWVLYWTVMGKR